MACRGTGLPGVPTLPRRSRRQGLRAQRRALAAGGRLRTLTAALRRGASVSGNPARLRPKVHHVRSVRGSCLTGVRRRPSAAGSPRSATARPCNARTRPNSSHLAVLLPCAHVPMCPCARVRVPGPVSSPRWHRQKRIPGFINTLTSPPWIQGQAGAKASRR